MTLAVGAYTFADAAAVGTFLGTLATDLATADAALTDQVNSNSETRLKRNGKIQTSQTRIAAQKAALIAKLT